MQKLFLSLVLLLAGTVFAQTITVASVNNGDMLVMEELKGVFEEANPGITVEFLFLDEGTLRSRLTTDVATGSGSFDLATVGMYEAPIWAENGWIESINGLASQYPDAAAGYDFDDLLPAVTGGLSYDGELYAAPFYAESSFTMYNKRLFEENGLTMPDQPTWEQIREFACTIHDPENDVYGIALRGKPGWGDNMAPITTVVNTHGGQWLDSQGKPQLNSTMWSTALNFYVDLVNDCGPPGVSGNSFPESLALMGAGQAGMWVDATVAAGFLSQTDAGPDLSQALAPVGPVTRGNAWLWSWNLGIPTASENTEAAFKFLMWATSKEYLELVGETKGWAVVPPGTRASLYEDQRYLDAAPFAQMTLDQILNVDPTNSTLNPTLASGVQFVSIPEFSGFGQDVAQEVTAAISGDITVEEALRRAQRIVDEAMQDAGYY